MQNSVSLQDSKSLVSVVGCLKGPKMNLMLTLTKQRKTFLIPSATLLKVYLRYKTITSQNVSSQAQIKNFFISQKDYVPFSRYSSFCTLNYPMIYRICDVTMSISTWDEVHFWIYLLNHNLWSDQTWPIDRYKQGQ